MSTQRFQYRTIESLQQKTSSYDEIYFCTVCAVNFSMDFDIVSAIGQKFVTEVVISHYNVASQTQTILLIKRQLSSFCLKLLLPLRYLMGSLNTDCFQDKVYKCICNIWY